MCQGKVVVGLEQAIGKQISGQTSRFKYVKSRLLLLLWGGWGEISMRMALDAFDSPEIAPASQGDATRFESSRPNHCTSERTTTPNEID